MLTILIISTISKQTIAITGKEVSEKISTWLLTQGIEGKPLFSKIIVFKDCGSDIQINKAYNNYKTLNVKCLEKNGFNLFVRIKLNKLVKDNKKNKIIPKVTNRNANMISSKELKKNKTFHTVKLKRSLEKNDIIKIEDLDLIITGSLDDLFDYPGEVMIIKDWIKKDGTGNSSVYRFEVGAHPEILSEFEKSFQQIKNTHRNEQEYLSAALMAKNALVYWPDEWCRSFKRHCLKPFWFLIARETQVPENARVIVFHGKPDPHEAIAGVSGKWYRRFKPATWITDHWR